MKWRDVNGRELAEGDIIEDIRRRVIGRVIIQRGMPAIMVYKQFSTRLMGYEPVEYKAPQEAYIRELVERHTRIWWMMHGYVLENVEILKHTEESPKKKYRSGAAFYGAQYQ